MDKLHKVHATSSNKVVLKRAKNTHPYPTAKVILTFAAAPAIAGMAVLLLIALFSMQFGILIISPFVIFFAEALFLIPALITGIIVSTCRWRKDDLDLIKAAAVGGMSVLVSTMFFSPGAALLTGMTAAVVSLLLGYLVLPNAEYLDIPIYQHTDPYNWAVEIPTLKDETQPTSAQTGFYYLKDLPQHKH